MTEKKIIKLLKSGNFTLRYDDNGSCVLIEGKFDEYEDTYNYDAEINNGDSVDFDGYGDGYIPVEVEWLVKALGGNVISI